MDPRPLTFADLGLPTPLVDELTEQGITAPFPIQQATISDALAGRDTLGRGRTGSGKTLAFSLPMLTRLHNSGDQSRKFRPRAVILVPTRELANQVRDVLVPLADALNMRVATVYGGVSYNGQINALRNGVDIVVACPGRFIDLMESGHVELDAVEITILDEADHMAELGFLEHVTRILEQTPRDGQRLLFSATLDRGIDKLVRKFLNNPVTHEVESNDEDDAAMTHYFFQVTQGNRFDIIADLCAAPGRSLVFTRTKHGARKLTAALVAAGVPSVELHGDLSQAVRARNLAALSKGKVDTLVATDIAARGIHVDNIAVVIHADPPEEHKAFLHRSGRTARAGAEGTVVTMVTENMRRHVKRLARDAGIDPITKTVVLGDEILTDIAPGERTRREMPSLEESRPQGRGNQRGNQRRGGSHNDRRDSRSRDDRPRFSRDDRRDERPRFDRDERRDDRAPRNRDDRRDDRREGRPRFERDDRRDSRSRDDRPARAGGEFRNREFRADDDRQSRSRDDRAPRNRDDRRDDRREGRPRFDRDDRAPRGARAGGKPDGRAPRGTRSDSRSGRPAPRGKGAPARKKARSY
jgi:superfamily II DNA/RNA helicase